MQIGAIIQARFSSQRLPGKVLRPLCGKPLLAHLVDRLKRSTALDVIGVATSIESSDDAVAAFCASAEISCYRGSKNARAATEREHVTPYIYTHPDLFRIRNLVARVARPTLQLSVDTEEDLVRIEAILSAAGARADRLDLDEAIELAELFAPEETS